ncbi:MAG: hypothetical protein J6Z05_04100, partial [Lachnospiraceae bacterium]|nr:hypothetical protein [Lachnospiraceae bacterium]
SIHEIQSMLNDINIEHSIVEVIDYEKRSHTLMEYEERKKLPVDETFILSSQLFFSLQPSFIATQSTLKSL